jgi:hypothetical protein
MTIALAWSLGTNDQFWLASSLAHRKRFASLTAEVIACNQAHSRSALHRTPSQKTVTA